MTAAPAGPGPIPAHGRDHGATSATTGGDPMTHTTHTTGSTATSGAAARRTGAEQTEALRRLLRIYRPALAQAVPDGSPAGEWATRARQAGHPVPGVRPGRFRPRPVPARLPGMAPNDLLDVAREHARARVEWIHATMPTSGDALALAQSIRGPRPQAPGVRRGWPRVPWNRLVAEQHIGPRVVSDTKDGRTVHVVEIPATWLRYPIATATPAARQVTA